MKLICSCGNELTEVEEGINGTDYYECECGKSYNVLESEVKE